MPQGRNRGFMKRVPFLPSPAVLVPILIATPGLTHAQGVGSKGAAQDLAGVYQSIPDGTALPGGLRNSGSPSEISLTPSARDQMKAVNPKDDPWKKCQPVGQFRMMARDNTVFEILPAGGLIIILFEDFTHGFMRKLYLNRGHAQRSTTTSDPDIPLTKLTWFGDSIAHWEKDTLVIDAVDFNDRTWLNDAGAPHSDALHTTERLRAIRDGQFLEYKMTAEDPQALAKPYTYVRYFKKLDREFEDDNCVEE